MPAMIAVAPVTAHALAAPLLILKWLLIFVLLADGVVVLCSALISLGTVNCYQKLTTATIAQSDYTPTGASVPLRKAAFSRHFPGGMRLVQRRLMPPSRRRTGHHW